MTLTLLHNPRCSTSRSALEACEASGVEVEVVRYLDVPLNEQALLDLFEILEDEPADLVRRDKHFEELELGDEDLASPERIATLLADHPKLMQRPVLIGDDRAVIGRPKDRIPAFLEEQGASGDPDASDD